MSDQIKAGDVVQLKSGSVRMTVSQIFTTYETVEVLWFDFETKTMKSQDGVKFAALEKVDD